MHKMKFVHEEVPSDTKVKFYGIPTNKKVIVSWGSVKGPILDAMEIVNLTILEVVSSPVFSLNRSASWPL